MNNRTQEKTKIQEKDEKRLKRRKAILAVSRALIKKGVGTAEKIASKYTNLLCDELKLKTVRKKNRGKVFLSSLILFTAAIFISCIEMGQDCFPVSAALLCACGTRQKAETFTPRPTVALTLGAVVISALFMGKAGVLYFSVLLAVFIARSVFSSAAFAESDSFRVVTSFLTGGFIGFVCALISDFSLLSLVSWVTLCAVCPIFTYLLIPIYDMIDNTSPDTHTKEKERVALFAAAFLLVMGFQRVRILGLSFSALLSYGVTVSIAKRHGSSAGGLTGLVLGAACSSPVFSPCLGICGMLSGLLFPSDFTALLATLPTSVVISVFLGGTGGFLSVVPEVMAGFLLSLTFISKVKRYGEKITFTGNIAPGFSSGEYLEKKLEKMSGIFSGLSEVFFSVCVSSKPKSFDETRELVETACNGVCALCSASGMCWGRKWRDTNGTMDALAHKLVDCGRVSREDFPKYFTDRCVKTDKLCDEINALAKSKYPSGEQTSSSNRIAGEYRTVSKLLKSTAEYFASNPDNDTALSKKAEKALAVLGISYGFVSSRAGRCSVIDVVGVYPENLKVSTLDLISAFENECSMKFEEPEFISTENNSVLRLRRRREIQLECAKKTCVKKGEGVSGDTVSFFENDEGSFFSLISDGMGSGKEAALTSRLASVFVEKLLLCTDDKETTVDILNSMLISNNGECFTTLDLAEIDLFEKKAYFIKAGAAPSYVIRGSKAYKINSQTPPAGIINDFRAEVTALDVRKGDIIILCSDGIEDGENGFSLTSLVCDNTSLCAEALCQKIMNRALELFSARDDMSVVVIKVSEE